MAIHRCPHCQGVIQLEVRFTKAPPMQSDQVAPSPGTLPPGGISDLLDLINFETLDDAAKKFVDEIAARYEKYGEKALISYKQMAWLQRLAER